MMIEIGQMCARNYGNLLFLARKKKKQPKS